MTELLFKLKKDGKCVGYMKFSSEVPGGYLRTLYQEPGDVRWFFEQAYECQFFDSIHPWICKDHHGKDVYCDDWVLFRLDNEEPGERTQITWNEEWHSFMVIYRTLKLIFKREDIELIEDQP